MTASVSFTRNDGGYDVVTPNLTVQATAGLLTGAVNRYTATATHTAVVLQANYPQCSPVVVHNVAAAQAGVVFPPVGGSINGAAANASIAIPAAKAMVFYALPNGLDYIAVTSA